QIGDVSLGQALQLYKHGIGVEARSGHELGRSEAGGSIRFVHDSNVADVELRPVAFMLAVDRTDLEELPDGPFRFTGCEPRTITPDHEAGRPPGVTETAGEVRLAFARGAFGTLTQQSKEVGRLSGCEVAQARQRWFGLGHDSLSEEAGVRGQRSGVSIMCL